MRWKGDFMKIAVLDDESIYIEKISTLIHEYFPYDSIDTYTSAADLIRRGKAYDLLVLDIEMPETDGITFAKNYAPLFNSILFVTSFDRYVFDSFLPNVKGFVVKDQINERLIPEIQKIKSERENSILFNTEVGVVTVPCSYIQYFYTEDTFVYLVTLTKKYSLTVKSLKQLPINYNDYFFVSRSHLIKITNVLNLLKHTGSVEMKNRDIIKVSRRNWKYLIDAFMREVW